MVFILYIMTCSGLAVKLMGALLPRKDAARRLLAKRTIPLKINMHCRCSLRQAATYNSAWLLISKKLNFKNWISIVVFSSVFYSPWVIRNYIVFDRFIPTKTPVWQNIYLSYTSSVNILDDVKLILDKNSEEIFRLRRHVSEFEMEKIYKRETLKALDGKQNIVLLKMAQNVLLLWYVPSRYYYDNSLKIIFGRKIFVCLLNVFTILSLIYL